MRLVLRTRICTHTCKTWGGGGDQFLRGVGWTGRQKALSLVYPLEITPLDSTNVPTVPLSNPERTLKRWVRHSLHTYVPTHTHPCRIQFSADFSNFPWSSWAKPLERQKKADKKNFLVLYRTCPQGTRPGLCVRRFSCPRTYCRLDNGEVPAITFYFYTLAVFFIAKMTSLLHKHAVVLLWFRHMPACLSQILLNINPLLLKSVISSVSLWLEFLYKTLSSGPVTAQDMQNTTHFPSHHLKEVPSQQQGINFMHSECTHHPPPLSSGDQHKGPQQTTP